LSVLSIALVRASGDRAFELVSKVHGDSMHRWVVA
jgi:hypothetical protein